MECAFLLLEHHEMRTRYSVEWWLRAYRNAEHPV